MKSCPNCWHLLPKLTRLFRSSPCLFSGGTPAAHDFLPPLFHPRNCNDVLNGAIVATQIVINHHRFPNHHSFTGLIKALYVLQAGPSAPEMGKSVYTPQYRSVEGDEPDDDSVERSPDAEIDTNTTDSAVEVTPAPLPTVASDVPAQVPPQ